MFFRDQNLPLQEHTPRPSGATPPVLRAIEFRFVEPMPRREEGERKIPFADNRIVGCIGKTENHSG